MSNKQYARDASANRYYPSVEFCIYCRAPSEICHLHEEHIIPLSFGGKLILPLASCDDCGAITSATEGYCCERMFKSLRIERGLPTRRKKKRPTHLPVIEQFAVNIRESTSVNVPVEDFPSHMILPIFAAPDIFKQKEPIKGVRVLGHEFRYISRDTDDRIKRLEARGLKGVKIFAEFSPFTFARVLAKIAHSFAVAEYGLQTFKPTLMGIIRGEDHNASSWIGGAASMARPPPSQILHSIASEIHHIGDKSFIVVFIRLFSDLVPPMPIYAVVAGRVCPVSFDWSSDHSANAA